jgi:hypothetical protein
MPMACGPSSRRDRGAHRDAIVLNTALALEVAAAVPDAASGIEAATAALDRGDGAHAGATRGVRRHAERRGLRILRSWACSPTCNSAAASESMRRKSACRRRRCARASLRRPQPPGLRLAHRGFDLVAELKLRSPSLGDLSATTVEPARRLAAYAEGGAAVCSILTEPALRRRTRHLRVAAEVLVPYGVPAMRKDFLVDPLPDPRGASRGAAGVLLIVGMLARGQLASMLDCAADHWLVRAARGLQRR